MVIQYVAIGSELLDGLTLNTNSFFISKKLAQIGFHLSRHVVVPDDEKYVKETILHAIENYQITIFTGGLGPTCDDLTKEIVAKVMGKSLVFSTDLFDKLKKRYPNLTTIENQSIQIEGSILFENSLGTAVGFAVKKNESILIFLPGVPKEMEDILERQVIPWMKREFPSKEIFEKKYTVLIKKEHEIDPFLRKIQDKEKNIHIGIYPNYGYLTIYFSSNSEKCINDITRKFEEEFKTYFIEEDSIAQALLNILSQKNLTIALAESCTGGMISEMITAIPGASRNFIGSVVAYSNASKKEILSVQESTLKNFGAVSQQCAIELTEGVKKIFNASVCASITGIAGPDGGSIEKPVGTVYYSFSVFNDKISGKIPQISINKRSIVICYTANYLLASIYRYIKFQINPD